ncbi:MAG: sensor histidine kinase [Wolinella sp.]
MSHSRAVIAKILALYLITSGVFLLIFFGFLYARESYALLLERTEVLKEARGAIFVTMREHGIDSLERLSRELDLKFALMHKERVIYSNLLVIPHLKEGVSEYDGRVYLVLRFPIRHDIQRENHHNEMAERYRKGKGDGLLILEGDEVSGAMAWLRVKFIAALLGALSIIGVVAYFLVRLSLKPLHEKIDTLNRFIKDSTHEINTPLSVIMMSIETMEREHLGDKNNKKLNNIELAVRNLVHIYEDLVCLNFPHTIPNECEEIGMKSLIEERVGYFSPMAMKKEITWQLELEDSSLFGSRHKICKMLDNLISNAIKYSAKRGEIVIHLCKNRLEIIDSGEGMSETECAQMFERYTRFNRDQGGFGIGLSLVRQVCLEHKIALKCESKKGSGTRFLLEWGEN